VVLFELITGSKGEKLNFYTTNISPLLPVINPKSTTFLHMVSVQRPREIKEKNSKKAFFGICTGPKTLYLNLKNFLKNFLEAFGT
jgi:hypothetical protein